MNIQVGQIISHYRIVEQIGQGGMGVVYKAEDTKLHRHVALKFLPQEWTRDPDAKARFMNEARAASALEHHNICNIHEIDETEDGQLFIVMAFYEGETVREKIERGPLKLDDAIDLAIQIAEGLTKAHQKDIVHRDLKPANVLVTEDGVAKIVDFGLAKLAGRSMLTKEGTTLGTASYMSPEQARGEMVDQRTDIFSLGVLVYEMITGQLPFKGDYEQAVVYSIINEDPEPLTGLRTGVPLELERAVFKCLQKSPDERYQSATDLLVDLRRLSKGADIGPKSVLTTAAGSRVAGTRSRRGLFTAGAIGLAALLAVFVYFQKSGDPNPIRLTNPRKITQAMGWEGEPTWSPDGTKIAYTAVDQSGRSDIWIRQLSGGEPINLTSDMPDECWNPSWSPEDGQIAFMCSVSRLAGYTYSIWLVPSIGGTPIRVTETKFHSNPVWSPDGSQLAHVLKDSVGSSYAEIYTLPTHKKRRVPLPGTEFERVYLSWSPQGDSFAYTDAVNLRSLSGVSSSLRIVRIADGRDFQITDDVGYDYFPTWSLDSQILYFISIRDGTSDLWQAPLNDEGNLAGRPEQISSGLEMETQAFSQDRTKVAFSKLERASNVWRVPIPQLDVPAVNWSTAQQMTFESSTIDHVDLSLDGNRIYFTSQRSGNRDLWSMDVPGGPLRQLTSNPEDDSNGRLSPDGTIVAFTSDRGGNLEIWTMPAAGGPAKQVTSDGLPKWWPRWSPDGQTLAFTIQDGDGRLSLCTVPAAGGETKQITTGNRGPHSSLWWPDGESLVASVRSRTERIVRFGVSGDSASPLVGPDILGIAVDGLRWSRNMERIYFLRETDTTRNIWGLSLDDGSVRKLTDFSGRHGILGRSFARWMARISISFGKSELATSG